MVTNENAIKITSEQARALRKADSVVFHYKDGQHYIRAIKEDRDEFGRKTREIRIDVQGRVEKYSAKHNLGEVEECSTVLNHAQQDKPLKTAFAGIRSGDILYLRWISGNNNQYLNQAGLFADSLYLQVHRGEFKNNVKEYHIKTSITPNNSAKMCKHSSTPYMRM